MSTIVARWSMPNGSVSTNDMLHLQRQIGNQAVSRLMSATGMIQREMEDGDKVAEGSPAIAVAEEAVGGVPQALGKNKFGDIDVGMTSNVEPHAFTSQGSSGAGIWHHCGGTGGKGNENCGSIQQIVAPVYESKPAANGKPAKAWVQAGTGTVTVTRSYTGVTHGDQGNYTHQAGNLWMSPSAQARIDTHEVQHVNKTKELYAKHIKPLRSRIKKFSGSMKSRKSGATEPAAEAALQTRLDWNKALTDFAQEDINENTPGGPVDTKDQASAGFYKLFRTSTQFKRTSNNDWYLGTWFGSWKGKSR